MSPHPREDTGGAQRFGPLLLAACFLSAIACEGSDFARATKQDSVQGYRRFLANHPKAEPERVAEARRRLEQAVYRHARRVDSPLGYRLYLQEFPKGRLARRARERLAALALARAKDPAGLELVLERHPGTPQAAEAARRLAGKLARIALTTREKAPSERFLARFAGHPKAPAVRERLARLSAKGLGDELAALERFVDRFKGTETAVEVEQRLADRLAELVEATKDSALLSELELRFPGHRLIAHLKQKIRNEQILEAVATLDEAALAKLAAASAASPTLARLRTSCARRPAVCADARSLARRAGPYRPVGNLETLIKRLHHADPLEGWRAAETLAYRPEGRAGLALAEQLSSARFGAVWAAERALRRWLGLMPAPRRLRWLRRATARAPHPANLDDAQRYHFLRSLAPGTRGKGQRGLEKLLTTPARALGAAHLLLATQRARPSNRVLLRLLEAARARVKRLEDAFPSALSRDAAASGVLAERELYAVLHAVEAVGKGRALPGRPALLHRCRRLLSRWRDQLVQVSGGFTAAQVVDLSAKAQRHERGRAAARRELARRRDLPSRAVHVAIQELYPVVDVTQRSGRRQGALLEQLLGAKPGA